MTKSIWGADPGSPVETSGGGKVTGEYFGLHQAKNEKEVGALSHNLGSSAATHIERSKRMSLNEGVLFGGFLVSRQVDHVILHIGMHPLHGLSAHIDRPTSHSGGRIEVITSNEPKQVVISRNEFYSELLVNPIADTQIDEFVKKHWRV
jgi:hypothetical protein